jgi:hypothetical protein
MQQVLNSQERTQAFLKFLLFFLITVVLIIIAIFFNYRLPVRENKMLQEEVDVARTQEFYQQKFVRQMQAAVLLLDSLDKKNVNFEQINVQLGAKMNELNGLQQKDSSVYGQMNKEIVYRLQQLKDDKKIILDLNTNATKLPGVQAELDNCRATLDAYRKANGLQQ